MIMAGKPSQSQTDHAVHVTNPTRTKVISSKIHKRQDNSSYYLAEKPGEKLSQTYTFIKRKT